MVKLLFIRYRKDKNDLKRGENEQTRLETKELYPQLKGFRNEDEKTGQ